MAFCECESGSDGNDRFRLLEDNFNLFIVLDIRIPCLHVVTKKKERKQSSLSLMRFKEVSVVVFCLSKKNLSDQHLEK